MKGNRRRYLLFHLHKDNTPIDGKDVVMAIWKNLLSLYGEIHAADSKLYLMDFDGTSGLGVLQCNAKTLPNVITAAALIGSINGVDVSFEPKKTSGTIKGLHR